MDDIVRGTPWVGGKNGNFVQVNAAAQSGEVSLSQANVSGDGEPAACSSDTQSDNAETVGQEIGGRVLGGGWGRSVGGAVGGLLGSRKKAEPAGC